MKQQGIALITVLSVLAVVSILSATMLLWERSALQQTTKLLQASQSIDYLYAMEDWAESVLLRDLKESKIDSLDESWALHLAPTLVDRGAITGHMEDMQGRFNLNNLFVDGKYQQKEGERFKRLMEIVGITPTTAQEINNALRDWIDPDQSENFPGGAEDYYYLNLSPPYRAADGYLVSTTELLLIKGVTPTLWEQLEPHIAALPGYQPVNVNTATKAVLQSLSSDIDEKLAEDILDHRMDTPFTSIRQFMQFRRDHFGKTVSLPELSNASVTIASQYFLLYASANVDNQQMQEKALIHRYEQDAGVIQRSYGANL